MLAVVLAVGVTGKPLVMAVGVTGKLWCWRDVFFTEGDGCIFTVIVCKGIRSSPCLCVAEWGGEDYGKQVGSMNEEPQVRGCYNITFICTTPTNQETVSVLKKTQAKKKFRT